MKEKVLIYGIGSLGEKIFEYNKRDELYEIVGFIDDKENLESTFCGLPTMNYDICKQYYPKEEYRIFVAIGYVRCNYYREKVVKKVFDDGYELINYISPYSICWENTILGKNIFVADNVFVGHKCKIYDGVIISAGCVLSHENEVKDYSFISSCVAFGGHSKVANNCFIGLHSTIKDNIVVAEYNIVGCGANVLKSTQAYSVTIGNPGKSYIRDTMSMKI